MKRFYSVQFGYPEMRLEREQTLRNGHRSQEECYSGMSEVLQYADQDLPHCDRPHDVGREIVSMLADGQTLIPRYDVIALGEDRLAFAFDLEQALDHAKIDLGVVVRVHWAARDDDRLFVTPAMTPKELVIARPALQPDDEPACKHCGSPRLFCGECLAFLGACGECGVSLSLSDLYRSVSDSRKRRAADGIVFYKECIVADDAKYDVAASALRRRRGPSRIYYSEELLDFIADRLMCQIAVKPLATYSRAEYREILTAIGALTKAGDE